MITLDEKRIPDFVKVNSVEFSVLPPIQNNLLKVRGKAGSYLFSQDYDSRIFTVYFTIIADKINGVMETTREFAEWLHNDKPVKLVFDDEPDKYYLVVPNGESNLVEIMNIGQGSIEFICIEPFAYGEEKTETFNGLDVEQSVGINVGGNVETHPQINLTVKENITSMIVESDDTSIIIGEPSSVNETPTNIAPLILVDTMQNMDGWDNTHEYSLDAGIKVGKFTNNVNAMYVEKNDFGSGDMWHGPSVAKTLDKPLTDFSIYFRIDVNPTSIKQLGRLELYLLDEHNVQFGKISMHDSFTSTSNMRFEARAGTWGKGTYFLNKTTPDYTSRFYGRMLLTREGRKWTVSVADTFNKGIWMNEILYATWFDSEDEWGKYDLSKIQVHIGASGKHEPIKNMYISHIEVKERLTLEESQVPIIAIKNDLLTIDNSKMLVYLNGEPRFDLINPASNFINLQSGNNRLSISEKADMEVTYNERWL